MAKLKQVRRFGNVSSLANGDSFTFTWTADTDYTVKYIRIQEASGKKLDGSDVTIAVGGETLTKEEMRLSNFQGTFETLLEIDFPLDKSQELKFSGKNEEGTTVTFVVELYLYKSRGFNE